MIKTSMFLLIRNNEVTKSECHGGGLGRSLRRLQSWLIDVFPGRETGGQAVSILLNLSH